MKIIDKKKIRVFLLKNLRKSTYYKILYFKNHKLKLNISNPKRFSEKLFLLKEYYGVAKKDFIQKIYDKYIVREYVNQIVGDKYLTKLYGVYNNADEIDFEKLPQSFILKITQSSGLNIVCMNKNDLDYNDTILRLNKWLSYINNIERQNESEEGYAFNGKAQIICEELLKDEHDQIPKDVRIWCFNGKPKFYCIDYDSVEANGTKKHKYYRNVYGLNGKFIPVNLGRPFDSSRENPFYANMDEMLQVAKKLAQNFEFVRVDLYNVNGRIIFGELTPIPQGGKGKIKPIKYDYLFGKYLDISHIDVKKLFK